MNNFLYLVPIALGLGLVGLVAFMWALRSGQYDDLDGAAERILFDDDRPLPERPGKPNPPPKTARPTQSAGR
jgi:cbb3-type cytochrome oxidase maturation protein